MVTITTRLPETGLELPSPAELARLRKIVLAAHPWLRDGAPAEREFVRAFWAAGMAFRTASPCRSRSFAAFVDDACELLTQYGSEGVGGSAFMAACSERECRRLGPAPPQALKPHPSFSSRMSIFPKNVIIPG